jgi:hypothetical protein
MVALLTSERLDVLVLLDNERAGRETKHHLLNNKLIRESNILFVTEAFSTGVKEADIEDIIEPKVYDELVREAYEKELRGKNISLNPQTPRIVKRYEDAFDNLGVSFQKTRPARLFMTKVGSEPQTVLTNDSIARFEKIFQSISHRLKRHKEAQREPFNFIPCQVISGYSQPGDASRCLS